MDNNQHNAQYDSDQGLSNFTATEEHVINLLEAHAKDGPAALVDEVKALNEGMKSIKNHYSRTCKNSPNQSKIQPMCLCNCIKSNKNLSTTFKESKRQTKIFSEESLRASYGREEVDLGTRRSQQGKRDALRSQGRERRLSNKWRSSQESAKLGPQVDMIRHQYSSLLNRLYQPLIHINLKQGRLRYQIQTFISYMVRIIENYTLYEIIGEGAYGKVFRAINKNDNKQYAVKVIEVRRFKENKKLEECTVNEINILTNIEKHEHIIKYIDMLKTPNNFYFVYEYCNGGTLEGVLRKDRVIPEKQALLVFKQLIDAFQVLNKYNIMHRDLKPDNIFFNNGVVKLGDFGFCKSLEKANMTKTMLGSPIYMAPQILRGEIYSTKADIWSLGVVLYEMLYGFCPFESTTIPKLIEVLKETELEFPSKEQVSEETKRLLKKLLTKDPTKRIEWMELLKINITNQGRLLGNKQERLSLVQEDGLGTENKLVETGSFPTKGRQDSAGKKTQDSLTSSTQAYSPPSTYSHSQPVNPQLMASQGASFLKKKPTFEAPSVIANNSPSYGGTHPRRNSAQITQNQTPEHLQNPNIKRLILKEHGETTRGFHIAVELIKSNDNNAVLFAYLILRKAEQRLVTIRDEVAGIAELKELVMCLNSELKDISLQLSRYSLNENLQNWKALVKATGQFHRNFRAFYMMVVFLSGEIPRDDLSHVQMQMQVRNKLY